MEPIAVHYDSDNGRDKKQPDAISFKKRIKRIYNESTTDDVNKLIAQKNCTGNASFVFSVLSKIFIGTATVFSGLQLNVAVSNLGMITLVCNTMGMTCIGLSHYFATECKDKIQKLSEVVDKMKLNNVVIVGVASEYNENAQ